MCVCGCACARACVHACERYRESARTRVRVCVYAHVCVCVCQCVCVCARVHICVCVNSHTFEPCNVILCTSIYIHTYTDTQSTHTRIDTCAFPTVVLIFHVFLPTFGFGLVIQAYTQQEKKSSNLGSLLVGSAGGTGFCSTLSI